MVEVMNWVRGRLGNRPDSEHGQALIRVALISIILVYALLPSSRAALPADDGRIEYTVTATAPPRVAGRRVKPGDTLRLTEEEARGELLALHIAPPRAAGLTAEQVAAVTEIL